MAKRKELGSRTGLVEAACLTHDQNGIDQLPNFSLKESALHKFITSLRATKLHQTGPRTHGLRNELAASKLNYVGYLHKLLHHYCQLVCSFLGVIPGQKDEESSKAGPEPVHGGVHLVAQPVGLGTEADFRELVVAAHQRGIRLVLDFVVNHLSNVHPAFIAAQHHPSSPSRDWFFFRDSPDAYESFYDV